MVFLITCKNGEDPIKMEELEWPQDYTPSLSVSDSGSGGIVLSV